MSAGAPEEFATFDRMAHLSREQLESGLDTIREAPGSDGVLRSIVRRPQVEERELLEEGQLELEAGLAGDNWPRKPTSKTGAPNPLAQITVMSARAAALIADSDRIDDWAPAGDQLYVDLDIGVENLPAGARLAIGEAVLEVTEEPHLGCGKFIRRFGVDAMKFVNSEVGRELRLRGLNALVVEPGPVAVGDSVRKL
ncbi:MOSC domain-containing protein [soil metagenome]